ncbi:MAG TPA: hypothetical protein VMT87_11920 [Vicinamibacteria bacterium]|nr:hypothetical protein [Vicinamibacteria bacterium]
MSAEQGAPPRRGYDVAATWLPLGIGVAGLLWAVLALVDPDRSRGIVGGPALAGAGLALCWFLRRPRRGLVVLATFTLAYALGAAAWPDLRRGDSLGYFVYLRSAAFDRDLDFANDYAEWGLAEPPLTATGRRYNQYTVGPAIVWSPFFLLGHLYALVDREVGPERHTVDGFSAPYLRSAALGTLTAGVAAAWLLGLVLLPRTGGRVAALAVVGAIATSPVLFYLFVHPLMSHGLTFAFAAALVWAADRVQAAPSRNRWLVLGALLGGATAMRLQAGVLGLVPVALAAVQLRRRRAEPAWIAGAAAAAALALVPQLVVWKVLHGRFLQVPSGPGLREWAPGEGWFDASSPRFVDVLFAADHGLFTWTPALILAALGLLLALRPWPALAGAGLVVLLATAWINGSLADWAGSDAFGGRRFDIVVPFLAVGYAALLELCRRRPLLAPAALLAALALWNVGVVNLFRNRGVTEAAALEEVAGRQARQLRRVAEDVLGRMAGPRGRAFAYKFFAGEFFYWNLNLAGTIDLGTCDARYLAGDWSGPENREGPPSFRWARRGGACVRFPLDRPEQDLRTVITARAPGRLESQTMSVDLNGAVLKQAALGREWVDVTVVLPVHLLTPGENRLCLRFSAALPEQDGSRAAAVSRIQLP